MLGKSLKYEFKLTARFVLPFYLGIIALALINRLTFMAISQIEFLGFVSAVMMLLYILVLFASVVMTLVVIIMRFYKGLLGEEGYLTMTLPVSASTHILSKLICGTVWMLATITVILVSIIVVVPSFDWLFNLPQMLSYLSNEMQAEAGMSLGQFLGYIVPLLVVCIPVDILLFYTAMAIGHLSSKQRLLCSFGAYLGIYFVLQIIMVIAMVLFGVANADILLSPNLNEQAISLVATRLMPALLLGVTGVQILLGGAYFFITRFLLKRKLNLA